jgi:hypothetical protein
MGSSRNFRVKPNDLTPTIDHQIRRKLQGSGAKNAQLFHSRGLQQREGQVLSHEHYRLWEALQLFDQGRHGLEFDTSFVFSFRNQRLDWLRRQERHGRRSHKVPHLEEPQAFGRCRNIKQNRIEFGLVQLFNRFAWGPRDNHVKTSRSQELQSGWVD